MEDLIRVIRDISSSYPYDTDGSDHILMGQRYPAIPISKNNFYPISGSDKDKNKTEADVLHLGEGTASQRKRRLLFVDGGNSILFESAAFALGFVRIAGISYQDNMRKERDSREFYVLVRSMQERYEIITYPKNSFDSMIIDPQDSSLKEGLEGCSPARLISLVRRFAELEYAADRSIEADYVLLDGTIEARYPKEDDYIKRLVSTGKACALSKTCSLETMKGDSITKRLFGIGPKQPWYYHPIAENRNSRHPADIFFVRLNPRSDHVFRFESSLRIDSKIDFDKVHEILSMLCRNSNDPVFIGYPYGFIDVDQYARVSDEESRMHRTRLFVKMGKEWNDFRMHMNSMNAHSILDNIRF